MKIKAEHYATIRAALRNLKAAYPDITPEQYEARGIGKDTAERFRWDAFRACRIDGNTTSWQCNTLYPYLNDSNIDTALRRVVAEVYGR